MDIEGMVTRLVRLQSGEPAQSVYGSENAAYTAKARGEDKEALLEVSLAEHDMTPVDEAWLRSIGADEADKGWLTLPFDDAALSWIIGQMKSVKLEGYSSSGVWLNLTSRGEIRSLCRILKLPINC